jgi:hypothetical protein
MNKEDLIEAVRVSHNKRQVLTLLGKHSLGSSYGTLDKYLNAYSIDISHFKRTREARKNLSLKDILVEGRDTNSTRLKKRLIKEGILENVCCICGQLPEWQGKELQLLLDHKNGEHMDNRLENLRIICRNCDSQLPTYGGRNKKIRTPTRYCSCGKTIGNDNKSGKCLPCFYAHNLALKDNKCCDCKVQIDARSKRCKKCSDKKKGFNQRKCLRPSLEELTKDLSEGTYVSVGKKYNVTNVTIKKWITKYQQED